MKLYLFPLIALFVGILGGCARHERAVEPLFREVHTLRVAVIYNDEELQIRYEFPTSQPSWYHDYFVYRSGEWTRGDSSGMAGPLASGLYEDRISVMLDDGSVPDFSKYGAYIVSHPGIRSHPDAPGVEEIATSFIGERGMDLEVNKFVPESRHTDSDEPIWRAARSEEELMELRQRGVFLNTWQWRAHRSNPIGYADQGYVLDYRHSSGGTGMYFTNWDSETNQPRYMHDPSVTGIHALRIERLLARLYSQDDPYFLSTETAVPFDPDHEWREGDAIPRRVLREPSGSRGSIRAKGRHTDGAWRVRVTRTLEAPDPLDSKTLRDGGVYNVQFAVHTGSTGAHWHLVSMPIKLGLTAPGHLVASRVNGPLDDAQPTQWLELPVAYPGILTLEDFQESDHAMALLQRAIENPLDKGIMRNYLRFVLRHQASVMR